MGTYEVGGLDADTDGLRPVVIGCNIVCGDISMIDGTIIYIYL